MFLKVLGLTGLDKGIETDKELKFFVNFIINDVFIVMYDGEKFLVPPSSVNYWSKKSFQDLAFKMYSASVLASELELSTDNIEIAAMLPDYLCDDITKFAFENGYTRYSELIH